LPWRRRLWQRATLFALAFVKTRIEVWAVMEKYLKVLAAVFTTRTLVQIACVLGAVLVMKGLGAYYGFDWVSALAANAK
jgi:hypothetical protein